MTWTVAYPADTLKTKLQTAKNSQGNNMILLARGLIKEHGFLYLYRGLHVQLLRAFPSTACSMLVLETTKAALSNTD